MWPEQWIAPLAAERHGVRLPSINDPMEIEIRQAAATDVDTVSSILLEAATWLKERDMPMWRANELFQTVLPKT